MSIIKITKDNFQSEVLESRVPVLADFWAGWCGPCRMLAPVIDEIAAERTDIKVGKIDVDEEPDLARTYRIMSIPTLVVFQNGNVVNKSVGVLSKEEILSMLPFSY
ncbi:MAG: thioredoxin [Lachnospiraceae bacterium]|nr:thioredoxin [Lachnospiraceae bacterium]